MFQALGFRTLFELILIVTVIWCIFHEDKLIAFEKRILSSFKRRRLKVVNTRKCSYETF